MELIIDPIQQRSTCLIGNPDPFFDDIREMVIKAKSSFWFAEEIDLTKDIGDWQKLNTNEQEFIKIILSFFAMADDLVIKNIKENYLNCITIREINSFYIFQMCIEEIHSEVYSQLILTLIPEMSEQHRLINAIENFDSIKQKKIWVDKWINSEQPFAKRLIAFAIVEGVFFSSSFASIFWIKTKNLLPGLQFSNELIARDEGLHTKFACLLFNKYIKYKPQSEEILEMMRDAVELEINFAKESLSVDLIGINSTLMSDYIKYIADRLLVDLNQIKIYNVSNPFTFIENISLDLKTNFFEGRVGEYRKSNITSNNMQFNMNIEF